MHFSGFDDAATESLTTEGTADDRLWACSPRVATIRRRTTDGGLAGRMTILGLFVTTLLLSPVLGSRRTPRSKPSCPSKQCVQMCLCR
jgi:hypothetical protein